MKNQINKQYKHKSRKRRFNWRGGLAILAVAIVIGLTGCEGFFDVTNPGPVQDEFLNKPGAFEAIVTGMERAHALALGNGSDAIAFVTAGVTREIFPSGNPEAYGITLEERKGYLLIHMQDGPWADAQNARWAAEHGVKRMINELGGEAASSPLVARGWMWAGFANRLLGENMCKAVIDGGEAQPRTVYLKRAEKQFTKAIEIAKAADARKTKLSAIAGRAQVRLDLRKWSGALADARKVPEDFSIQVHFAKRGDETYNIMYWSGAGTPWRTVTVWNTPYFDYYSKTGDPRTPWVKIPEVEYGRLERVCCGLVPFRPQRKYTSASSPIDVADGREMKLIIAEVFLHRGEWQKAMDLINELRTSVGVKTRIANNIKEAWKWLKRERGIELWLEGRRMNDIRRWKKYDVPGKLWPLERPSNPQAYLASDRDLCFPIPRSERITNPNIPAAPQGK